MVGFTLAHWPLIERMTQCFIVLIHVTPFIAHAGAVVVWFGFGWNTILFLISIVCVSQCADPVGPPADAVLIARQLCIGQQPLGVIVDRPGSSES